MPDDRSQTAGSHRHACVVDTRSYRRERPPHRHPSLQDRHLAVARQPSWSPVDCADGTPQFLQRGHAVAASRTSRYQPGLAQLDGEPTRSAVIPCRRRPWFAAVLHLDRLLVRRCSQFLVASTAAPSAAPAYAVASCRRWRARPRQNSSAPQLHLRERFSPKSPSAPTAVESCQVRRRL